MAKFHAIVFTLVLAVAGVGFAHAKIIAPPAKPRALDPKLVHLGSIEGKTYYAENSAKYTWGDAYYFCVNSGLRLATITSLDQHNFLLSKHPILGMGAAYWLGGRDYGSHVNFSWIDGVGKFILFQQYKSNVALSFEVSTPSIGNTLVKQESEAFRVICETY